MKKLVVLTGGMGSGKSTSAKILSEQLQNLGLQTVYIHAYSDLYVPLARKHDIPVPISQERSETTALVKTLYERFGRDIGTTLIRERFDASPSDTILVLDSKRNPEGIAALRNALGDECVIVGVAASTQLQVRRIDTRARTGDAVHSSESAIEEESKDFEIGMSLRYADYLIENNHEGTKQLSDALSPIARLIAGDAETCIYARALFEKASASTDNAVRLAKFERTYKSALSNTVVTNNADPVIQEFELKYLYTPEIARVLTSWIAEYGMREVPAPVLEDDIVIDTPDSALKQHRIMIRFRASDRLEWPLMTLKFKQQTDGSAKHDIELQKTLSPENRHFFTLVNDFLEALGLEKLDIDAIRNTPATSFGSYFAKTSYSRARMRIQKKRAEMAVGDIHVCLDELPRSIGTYIELEATSKEALDACIRQRGLDRFTPIVEDYGTIVMTHNEKLGLEPRVAIF